MIFSLRLDFLDLETGLHALRTSFFLGLFLLSDFQCTKAFSFHNRSSHRLTTIFSKIAPCRIFHSSPVLIIIDLVCRNRAVSSSRPACREAFLKFIALLFYVAAKATYIRLLHGKIGFLVFFGPSSVKRGRTHSAWMKYVVCLHLYIP